MIGSGIFIVSADIGRQVGQWGPGALLLVWVVTGAMTVTGALAYAELAAMMPKAGGQYVFLREGLSPLAGFLYGWTLFAVIQTGTIAAVAVAFAKFLGVLVPGVSPDVFLPLGQLRLPGASDAIQLGLSPQRVVAIVMIAVLTATNMRGVTLGAAIQTVFSVAKIGALAALVLLGLTLFRQPDIAAANFADFWGTGDWSIAVIPVIGAAMVGSLFSSDAWNNVTFAAAEVQNPTRNLPRALAIGTGTVSLLYILANVAYLNVLPFSGDPQRRRRARPRDPVRGAGSGGHRGHRGGARRRRRHGHGGGDPALDLRLQQRADSLRARGSTTRWRATTCSSSGRARSTRPTARRSSGWWPRRSGPACSASAAPTGSCSTT